MSNYIYARGECYGIVEDTNDPRKFGRVRVRVVGVHTDNKSLLPTEDLPWSTVRQSTNTWGSFSVLLEGDSVVGYFSDGNRAQNFVVTGTIPRVFASETVAKWLNPIKKDRPSGLPSYGTLGSTTISYAAVGDVANTPIAITNKNLEHACDFRYFIDLPSLNIALGQFTNPITEIREAITQGKNRAAQLMSLYLTQINTNLRLVINSLLPALGLDPTGQVSLAYSVAKDLFRKINDITKKIAIVAEMASFYVNLVKDIQAVVQYLQSLPARIKTMVQECVTRFMSSIENFINQLKTIPGVVSSNIDNIFAELGITNEDIAASKNAQSNTANSTIANTSPTFSDLIYVTVYNPDADHANTIMNYINENFANASVTLTNATANSFNKSSTQSP
jgi:hypothetical protein